MKNCIFLLMLGVCLLAMHNIYAQTAKISEEKEQLITYPFSDPDPVPDFGKMYPYFRFDGYAAKGEQQTWKMVELENDFIKVWITPEIGGKIWGAVEKITGKEFIYYNHAVKFRDVAMRGPWTSGGIEINFGIIGHAPTSSSPVDYFVRKNGDGSVSCFVGAIDLSSRTRWYVEVNLQKDKAYFTTRSVWNNPTLMEQSYYHWMNLGVKTAGNLEYIFPGNAYIGHGGNHSPWPMDVQGRKINFYENNNFGSYKSYHIIGEVTDFYSTYWHDDDFGFVHYAPYDEKPGRKIWIWGLSDQGMIWEDLLTDTDGQYTEIQSGRLFNQAGSNSSLTPFKHRGFAPASTDEWTEYWFPVKQTKGLKSAQPVGSVNLVGEGDSYNVWFCANEQAKGTLWVKNGKSVVLEKEIDVTPMQIVNESFTFGGNAENLSVGLDGTLLYDANQKKFQPTRPEDAPAEFNWETAYGHYMKGKELERQRNYAGAASEYKKSLDIEPTYVPSLTGMSALDYRRTDYNDALKNAQKALSIDTYDAQANINYALSSLALGDTISAIDGFSIASASVAERAAGYNGLASIFINKRDYKKALSYVSKSLTYNSLGEDAIQMEILCLRKLGLTTEAKDALGKLESTDPLNHIIRFETYFLNPTYENRKPIETHITNEMPHETYLEYALWYYKNGQISDANKVLELTPMEHPVVLLWKAYLNHLKGEEQEASALVNRALQQSTELVFPFRSETLLPLRWAMSVSDDWKLNYYAGLVYLGRGNQEKGKDLWMKCGNNPDIFSFFIARSRLFDAGSKQALNDVEKALSLAENNWRSGLFASRFFMKLGNNEKAKKLAADFYQKYSDNYYLALQHARLLEKNGEFSKCIATLQKTVVLPNEGATEGRIIWKNANIGLALELFKEHKYKKALKSIQKAKQWPVNLGVGKPYVVDERLENYIALQCFNKLKDSSSAKKMEQSIIEFKNNHALINGTNDLLTALLLKEDGKMAEADRIMDELIKKNPSSKTVQWCNAIYKGDNDKANTLAPEIDSSDKNFLFLKRIFGELL